MILRAPLQQDTDVRCHAARTRGAGAQVCLLQLPHAGLARPERLLPLLSLADPELVCQGSMEEGSG